MLILASILNYTFLPSQAPKNPLDVLYSLFERRFKSALMSNTNIDSIKLNVSRMTKDEAVSILKMLVLIAKESGNLDSVFSSNGSSGRGANGRYSLIAKATGISRTHIARIFNGEKNPSIETLTIIANTADISKESLLEYITT